MKFFIGPPWHSKGAKQQWLQFEFPRPVSINGFRTKAPDIYDHGMFKNFSFLVSPDGQTWTSVNEGIGIDQDCCAWHDITFDCVTSSYFRLYMIDNWGYRDGNYFVIQQMDLTHCTGKLL